MSGRVVRATEAMQPEIRPVRHARRWAAAIFVVLLAASLVTAVVVRRSATRDAEAHFRTGASQAALSVRQEVEDYFTKLRDIGAFVAAHPDATPDEFRSYVAGAGTFEELPSIVGVLFLTRVEPDDVDAYMAHMQELRGGADAFGYIPLGPDDPTRPHYIVSQFAPGAVDLQLPMGVDITPIESVTALVDRAGETGEGGVGSFQADKKLQEIAEVTNFPMMEQLMALDFFLGLPVFPYDPDGSRSDEIMGWVAAPVADFERVVAEAGAAQPEGLGFSLTVDLTDVGMGGRDDISRVAALEGTAGPRAEAAFAHPAAFQIEGVEFRLEVWSGSGADPMPATVPLILVGGLFASLLGAGVVYLRLRSIAGERAFAAELADRAQLQRDIVDSVTDAMVVLDREGSVVAANPAWAALRTEAQGTTHDDDAWDIGRHYLDMLRPSLRAGNDELTAELDGVLDGGGDTAEIDVPVEQRGLRRWYQIRIAPLRGRRGGAVVLHTDITERKREKDELEFKASRDALTGLLNRSAFRVTLDDAVKRARAEASSLALLFIDLDGFKPINDTFGHRVGDDLLREVAQRISADVRGSDAVARLGGDEFVILMTPLRHPDIAEGAATRILDSLTAPVRIGDDDIHVGASIGLAIVDAPLDDTGDTLLERADQAMYRAKAAGGRRYHVSS